MSRNLYLFSLLIILISSGCSTTNKMRKGEVIPSEFNATIDITTTKGIVLVPCEYEGKIKNYYFDTGAQLSDIQRDKIKGKRIEVRGASNRIAISGTEVLKSFTIGEVQFKNTFATNSDSKGLKEQIQNYGGIIGRTIIDRANWLIDLKNQTLTISNKELSDESYSDIPLQENSIGAPYTVINIEDKAYKAIIDLGSTSELNVPKDSELANELLASYDFIDQARERYTLGGVQSIMQQVYTIPLIQIGDTNFENVEVTINESSQIRIGMNLFKNRIVYIDNLNNKYRVK